MHIYNGKKTKSKINVKCQQPAHCVAPVLPFNCTMESMSVLSLIKKMANMCCCPDHVNHQSQKRKKNILLFAVGHRVSFDHELNDGKEKKVNFPLNTPGTKHIQK